MSLFPSPERPHPSLAENKNCESAGARLFYAITLRIKNLHVNKKGLFSPIRPQGMSTKATCPDGLLSSMCMFDKCTFSVGKHIVNLICKMEFRRFSTQC